MEGHCSTGQSPLWAVEPMEEKVLTVTLTYNVNMCYSINDNRTVIRKTLKESNLVSFNLQIPICRTTAFLPTCARSTIQLSVQLSRQVLIACNDSSAAGHGSFRICCLIFSGLLCSDTVITFVLQSAANSKNLHWYFQQGTKRVT